MKTLLIEGLLFLLTFYIFYDIIYIVNEKGSEKNKC